jgi:hypothetical protein
MFRGKEMVDRFIAWVAALPCGVDLIDELYAIPKC